MAAPHHRADAHPVGRRRQADAARLRARIPKVDPGLEAGDLRELRSSSPCREDRRIRLRRDKIHRGSAVMKFYCFHLMPYADLDLDYHKKYDSAWVTLPNSYYDPKKGHILYNRYLDELEYAEEG